MERSRTWASIQFAKVNQAAVLADCQLFMPRPILRWAGRVAAFLQSPPYMVTKPICGIHLSGLPKIPSPTKLQGVCARMCMRVCVRTRV